MHQHAHTMAQQCLVHAWCVQCVVVCLTHRAAAAPHHIQCGCCTQIVPAAVQCSSHLGRRAFPPAPVSGLAAGHQACTAASAVPLGRTLPCVRHPAPPSGCASPRCRHSSPSAAAGWPEPICQPRCCGLLLQAHCGDGETNMQPLAMWRAIYHRSRTSSTRTCTQDMPHSPLSCWPSLHTWRAATAPLPPGAPSPEEHAVCMHQEPHTHGDSKSAMPRADVPCCSSVPSVNDCSAGDPL